MRNLPAVVLVVVLGACSNPATSTHDETGVAAGAVGERSAAIAGVEAITPVVQAPMATPESSGPAPARLALDGEGLRSFAISSGSSRLIAFGTMRDEAMRMLETVQGMPARDQGENIDCAASYASWPDGLTVWFADGEFAGWSVGSADATVATASSLRVGSSREELQSAYDARIAPSTLGTEFNAGGIAGLLDSPDANARVTDLWAGRTCIAR